MTTEGLAVSFGGTCTVGYFVNYCHELTFLSQRVVAISREYCK